ncbi:MAG: D-Ala-D-Ala carboxypeptidase family metallohydrolase [Candidatus Melainabacteria bacterium]|nr:D-Ala-D-Ala carboxypeptidase family metallohydrolase [Candidatus Melainabacteria bacterium]
MNQITAADLACPCCHVQIANPRLLAAINQLQNTCGSKLEINSGYRCHAHNASVGGAPTSQHLLGMAADIHSPAHTPLDLYLFAEQIPDFARGGIGLYPQNLIHLDVRTYRARWYRPMTSGWKHHPGQPRRWNRTQRTCTPPCARARKTRLQSLRRAHAT